MIDYLRTGKWYSPRDALPPEQQNVLIMAAEGKPVVGYLANSVWYCYAWPSANPLTIGSTQAVDRWMYIPPVEKEPGVQVLVEALGASIEDLSLHRDGFSRMGNAPGPVIFSGADIRFSGTFDRVGPIENRPIARLRIIAEYLP